MVTEWERIPKDFCVDFIEGISRKVSAVLKTKDKYKKYWKQPFDSHAECGSINWPDVVVVFNMQYLHEIESC